MKILPNSPLGKWTVRMTIAFLLLITAFFAFMLFGAVTFDTGHWWDITVGIAVPVEIAAFILSIVTVRKATEKSVLVYASLIIGICIVLFLLLHSLFIPD